MPQDPAKPPLPKQPTPASGGATADQLRALVNGVKEYAIFMLEPDGTVATWNPGAERIKGYRPEEIIGQHFSRFYLEEDVRSGKPALELRLALESGSTEDEGYRVRKDGSVFWASVVITALWDEQGALRGFAKVTRDMTERRRANEDRLRLDAAREALRARDQFLSIASHELRTPLTALQLDVEVLEASQELAAPARERLTRIRRQVRRLSSLVQALLDVMDTISGGLRLKPARVPLATVVDRAVRELEHEIAASGSAIGVDVPAELVGRWDPLRLGHAIRAILHNAVKFGRRQAIEISARAEGGGVRVTIRDHGMGMSVEGASRAFQRFERTVPIEQFGGFGVGLWIAREIALAHGGDITVESTLDVGSTFEIVLPLEVAV